MRLSDSPKGLLHEGMPSVKHDLGRTRDIWVLPQCYLKASTWGMKWPIMFCYMSKMFKDSLRRHSTIKVQFIMEGSFFTLSTLLHAYFEVSKNLSLPSTIYWVDCQSIVAGLSIADDTSNGNFPLFQALHKCIPI